MFSLQGYHVVPSGSVVEILREVSGRKPRVLLLSGKLNDLASVELIPLLRKCNQSLKIILVDKEVPEAVRDSIGRDGGVYFHRPSADPLERANLLQLVRAAMESAKSDRP